MNPVQFKVSSVEDVKTKVKGMTVFNTEQVNTKKQILVVSVSTRLKTLDEIYKIHTRITF